MAINSIFPRFNENTNPKAGKVKKPIASRLTRRVPTPSQNERIGSTNFNTSVGPSGIPNIEATNIGPRPSPIQRSFQGAEGGRPVGGVQVSGAPSVDTRPSNRAFIEDALAARKFRSGLEGGREIALQETSNRGGEQKQILANIGSLEKQKAANIGGANIANITQAGAITRQNITRAVDEKRFDEGVRQFGQEREDVFRTGAEKFGVGGAESKKLLEVLDQMDPANAKALPEPERRKIFGVARDTLSAISDQPIEDQIALVRDNPMLGDRVRALALNELLVRQAAEAKQSAF